MTFVLQANKELQRQLELAKKESQKHLDQLTKCTAVTKDLLMREVSHGLSTVPYLTRLCPSTLGCSPLHEVSTVVLPLVWMWCETPRHGQRVGIGSVASAEMTRKLSHWCNWDFWRRKRGKKWKKKRKGKEEVVRRKKRRGGTKPEKKNVYLSGTWARAINLPPRLLHFPLFRKFLLYKKAKYPSKWQTFPAARWQN